MPAVIVSDGHLAGVHRTLHRHRRLFPKVSLVVHAVLRAKHLKLALLPQLLRFLLQVRRDGDRRGFREVTLDVQLHLLRLHIREGRPAHRAEIASGLIAIREFDGRARRRRVDLRW